MDDAQMGAMTDKTDIVWTVGIFTQVVYHVLRNFNWFSADSESVTDGLPE